MFFFLLLLSITQRESISLLHFYLILFCYVINTEPVKNEAPLSKAPYLFAFLFFLIQ